MAVSTKMTSATATSIRTSPAPGTGSGQSWVRMTSAGPNSVTTAARICAPSSVSGPSRLQPQLEFRSNPVVVHRLVATGGNLSDVRRTVLGMFDAVFVPADPPRAGRLALYGDLAAAGEIADGTVELVLPKGSQVRRTTVPARLLSIGQVLDRLTEPSDGSASWEAWRAAALAGMGLIARGRLVPDRSPGGYGAWRVAPLDPLDRGWLRNLGAAMSPYAHALPIEGTRPTRLVDPEQLVRAFWDALADTLVRTPAAAVAVRASATSFAEIEPVELTGPTAWLDET